MSIFTHRNIQIPRWIKNAIQLHQIEMATYFQDIIKPQTISHTILMQPFVRDIE